MSVKAPPPPGVPAPPDYLPEMEDELKLIVKNTVKALSPRIVAIHGPTGTGKSTVFPLAITHSIGQNRLKDYDQDSLYVLNQEESSVNNCVSVCERIARWTSMIKLWVTRLLEILRETQQLDCCTALRQLLP